MAPLTRMRATDDHVPNALMKQYYIQRASVPGTLIITEGTFISQSACGGFPKAPGIWNQEQIDAWKEITDEIHRQGCFIFCQIFAMGRAADAATAVKDGVSVVGPSAIAFEGGAMPRAMTIEEIKQSVQEHVSAARNAISAGFDGVECHGGNGYLEDQFIQDVSNQRTDEYGGSVENRSRFMNEIMKGVVEAIGTERTGLRLTPYSWFQGMRMDDSTLIPQFSDVITKASQLNLAYLHLVESRMSGAEDSKSREALDWAYKIWNGPLLIAGGYNQAYAQKLVDEEYPDRDILVIFGRYFLANPDLVYRIKESLGFNEYERNTFYSGAPVGYVDYPF